MLPFFSLYFNFHYKNLGILCSAQVNECLTNPCLYGGTCHDLVNGFECECPKGTSGQRCEISKCLQSINIFSS